MAGQIEACRMAGRQAADLGLAQQLLPGLLVRRGGCALALQPVQELMQFCGGAMAAIPVAQLGFALEQLMERRGRQHEHGCLCGGPELFARGLPQQAAPACAISLLQ